MGKPRARKAAAESTEPKAKISRPAKLKLEIPPIAELSGNVLSCGQNDVGQLGFSDDVPEKTRPALVTGVNNIVDIKTGGMHSLCLTKDGVIWTFGCNDEGALGRDTNEEGSEMIPTAIELPGKVVRISAGDSHSACLLDDGRVFAWGSFRDSHGSMGLTIDGKKNAPVEVLPNMCAVDIASGADHLVILLDNGLIYTIGCAEQGQLGRVCPRTATGESRRGKSSMLLPGLVTKKGNLKVDAIWVTTYATFVRQHSTNSIFAFGLNNYSQLALAKNSSNTQVYIPSLTVLKDVKKIAGGSHHLLVLTNDNKCHVIGRKEYGRLGLGDVENDVTTLTPVDKLKNVKIVDVECGDNNSFAISDDGKVYVWGMGSSSQLGTGEEDDILEPKQLVSAQVKDKRILKVSGGGQHTLLVVQAEVTETAAKDNKKKVVNEKKTKEPEELVTSTTEEVDAEMKEPEPPAEAGKTKGRKGKAAAKTNTAQKTNGNVADEEQQPQTETEPATVTDAVADVKETASEAGSSTTDDKGSEKSGKRGRKRKL